LQHNLQGSLVKSKQKPAKQKQAQLDTVGGKTGAKKCCMATKSAYLMVQDCYFSSSH
jgi:hypothetical protein